MTHHELLLERTEGGGLKAACFCNPPNFSPESTGMDDEAIRFIRDRYRAHLAESK